MEGWTLCFLVLCGLFRSGTAIMCYECNSAINSFCNDKILPDNLKRNCTDHDRGVTHTLCRKIVQQVEHEINGQTPTSRVIRSCGWDESKYKVTLSDNLKHDRGVTHTLCRKIEQQVEHEINGQTPTSRVIRSCGWDESKYKVTLPDNLKHDRGVTHTLCRKIVQQVEHEINGQTPTSRVIRSCGWDESKYKGACYHRSGYGGKQEVCSCTTDFCNGAAGSTSSAVLLAILAVAAMKKQL